LAERHDNSQLARSVRRRTDRAGTLRRSSARRSSKDRR
jgi:hypothetical protein